MQGTIALILNGHESQCLPYVSKQQRSDIIAHWTMQHDYDKIPGEIVIRPILKAIPSFLDDETCYVIRGLYDTGDWNIKQLSERFACSAGTIGKVIRGDDW